MIPKKCGFVVFPTLCMIAFLFSLFLSGCKSTDVEAANNGKTLTDLLAFIKKSGIKVDSIQSLLPDPLNCEEAMAVNVGGRQVGFYKYNTHWRKSRERLARIREAGEVHILGVRFDALVNGSFVMIDAEKNPEKKRLVEAFMKF